MEEGSNGKVEETTHKEVAGTGDERKEGAFEEDGESNSKVEVWSVREVSLIYGNSEDATETRREKEAKDSSSSSSDDEEGDDERNKKEEKIVPLAEGESVAENGAASVEPVIAEAAATEASEKVDAAAVEQKEDTEAEKPSDETANGVVPTAGAEETAPVAVDKSDAVVPAGAAAAAVEERATVESVLAEEGEKEGDSTPAAADLVAKQRGEDPSLAQPPADDPAVPEGGDAAEHRVDEGEIPDSTGSPPIISVSRRTVPPTSWRSCCGLFEVLRRSDG